MNLESTGPKKIAIPADMLEEDFDFKPLTQGLGFHQNKTTTEIKPIQVERAMPVQTQTPIQVRPLKPDMNVYQNDLSLFYGQRTETQTAAEQDMPKEKIYRLATKAQRVFAYSLDLALVISVMGLVLTIMARAIEMDLLTAWSEYPNEITPLVVTLFCGFYVIYFSIFEKTSSSTLGKGLLGLTVVDTDNRDQRFANLILRSVITLLNFVSLGLFSYFDLQNKVTGSKIIRID